MIFARNALDLASVAGLGNRYRSGFVLILPGLSSISAAVKATRSVRFRISVDDIFLTHIGPSDDEA